MNKIRINRNKYKEKPEFVVCYKCNIEKPFNSDYFHNNKVTKYKLCYTCKQCDKLYKEEHLKNNKTKILTSHKNWIKNNLLKGLCSRCSSNRLKTSNQFCEKHYFEDSSHKNLGTRKRWLELKSMLESQNYKCHYSGVDLVLGVNASIDHTKPSIKYPELKNEISNLKWVDIRVNRMKRELDEDQFLKICSLISNRFPVV